MGHEKLFCDGCGTEQVLAPGIDYYCPNKECNHDLLMALQGAKEQLDHEERREYERLHAKYGPTPTGDKP